MENIVTQQRAVIENIVVEMQNQRTGIDELYVGSKSKLEELDGIQRQMGAHLQGSGMDVNVNERIRRIEEEIIRMNQTWNPQGGQGERQGNGGSGSQNKRPILSERAVSDLPSLGEGKGSYATWSK